MLDEVARDNVCLAWHRRGFRMTGEARGIAAKAVGVAIIPAGEGMCSPQTSCEKGAATYGATAANEIGCPMSGVPCTAVSDGQSARTPLPYQKSTQPIALRYTFFHTAHPWNEVMGVTSPHPCTWRGRAQEQQQQQNNGRLFHLYSSMSMPACRRRPWKDTPITANSSAIARNP